MSPIATLTSTASAPTILFGNPAAATAISSTTASNNTAVGSDRCNIGASTCNVSASYLVTVNNGASGTTTFTAQYMRFGAGTTTFPASYIIVQNYG
jgi:hypothetical protein